MGIKIKKKKKFRRWQKNSGAIFEKGGVIMGWWDIVKDEMPNWYSDYRTYIKDEYQKIISHPNFNIEEVQYEDLKTFINAVMNGDINLDTGEGLEEQIDREHEELDRRLGGRNLEGRIDPTNWIQQRFELMQETYEQISRNRSFNLLQNFAETLGVSIEKKDSIVSFTHEGIPFTMTPQGLFIRYKTKRQIYICVRDKQRLPLGDYYVSLLGLVIIRPKELDVVHFAIELDKLFTEYASRKHMGQSILERYFPTADGRGRLEIFTPFNGGNSENHLFIGMIDKLKGELKLDLIERIRKLVVRVFGSERGFF